ncbi:hypothetical protein CSUI_004868, partial [Cystoisospora suis]
LSNKSCCFFLVPRPHVARKVNFKAAAEVGTHQLRTLHLPEERTDFPLSGRFVAAVVRGIAGLIAVSYGRASPVQRTLDLGLKECGSKRHLVRVTAARLRVNASLVAWVRRLLVVEQGG